MQYLIRADVPFPGHVHSFVKPDGTIAYTNGMTLEEYSEDRGHPFRVIDDDELDKLIEEHVESLVTEPIEETAKQFDYALNCLPPCRWSSHRGVEFFHISERVTHDLVSWHAKMGDRYFTFTDRASLPQERIAEKVAAASA